MSLYQHFRSEEKALVDQVLDWVNRVQNQYRPYLSDFLDPREQFIVQSLAGQGSDLQVHFYGGVDHAERKRALVLPDYYQATEEDFEIALVQVHYADSFNQISHGQVLGSLTGAGLQRSVLGDIQGRDKDWQFFIKADLADYVVHQVHQMGRTPVRLEQVGLDQALAQAEEWLAKEVSVTSMRLDVVLKEALNLSRSKAKELIEKDRVRVNWRLENRPDLELAPADVVSVRGFGRVRLDQVLGQSRKGKTILALSLLESKKK